METVLWMLISVAIFLLGDWLVDRKFGTAGEGAAMGIVVGSVVDGVHPQAIVPSADLAARGWGSRRLATLWLLVEVACGVAAAMGYVLTDVSSNTFGDRAAAVATGGPLAMLTNSLIPFAYERGRQLAGVATVVGF